MGYIPISSEITYDKKSRIRKVYRRIDRYDEARKEVETVIDGTQIDYGQPRYLKIYTGAYLKAMEKIGDLSKLVLGYLFDTISRSSNVAHVKQKEVALRFSVSVRAVEKAFSELKAVDLIRKEEASHWMVNPAIGYGCTSDMYFVLYEKYKSLAGPEKPDKGSEANAT